MDANKTARRNRSGRPAAKTSASEAAGGQQDVRIVFVGGSDPEAAAETIAAVVLARRRRLAARGLCPHERSLSDGCADCEASRDQAGVHARKRFPNGPEALENG